MPIYEYRCDACGHCLDALQKIADDPLRDCPTCDASALRRLVSAPNFRLKGSGWYETDFKSENETKRNLVDRPEETAAGKDKKGEGKKAAGDSKNGEGSGKTERSPKGKSPGKPGGDAGSRPQSRSVRGSESAAA